MGKCVSDFVLGSGDDIAKKHKVTILTKSEVNPPLTLPTPNPSQEGRWEGKLEVVFEKEIYPRSQKLFVLKYGVSDLMIFDQRLKLWATCTATTTRIKL